MKHLKKLIFMIVAILLSTVLFPIGLITNLIQIYRVGHFFTYLWKFLVELYKLVMDFFLWVALFFDRLGNVVIGNIILFNYVRKEYRDKTLFNQSEITISCSLGHCLENNYLSESGIRFVMVIDFILGKNHCKDAYEWQKNIDLKR